MKRPTLPSSLRLRFDGTLGPAMLGGAEVRRIERSPIFVIAFLFHCYAGLRAMTLSDVLTDELGWWVPRARRALETWSPV